MPYLGNEPAVAYTSTTKDSFSGDASTTDFTMSKSVKQCTSCGCRECYSRSDCCVHMCRHYTFFHIGTAHRHKQHLRCTFRSTCRDDCPAANTVGGLFKGERGYFWQWLADILRINEQALNSDVTIATENASCTIASCGSNGKTITITIGEDA